MRTVLSRKDLKHHGERMVFVRREQTVFVRTGNEWVKKLYFDVKEVAEMLHLKRHQVFKYCNKLGIKPEGRNKKLRITFRELREIAIIKQKNNEI